MANIKVAVRVRPISEREIHLTGSEIVVHTEAKAISLTNLKVSSSKAGDSRERTRRYGFDYCFDSSDPTAEKYASQSMIYETLGESILDVLFNGYNSCLVAYGQSSSGKTYTMMGSKEDPGLTPRVCEGLFLRLADEGNRNKNLEVSVSYLEVYNERVRDLLKPSSNSIGLRVREHPRLGPYVQGLTHHAVPTLGSLISRVEEGTRARKTASTLQNPTSSRSHALLTLSLLPSSNDLVRSVTDSAATPRNVSRRNDHFPRGSKLHLVDLAGSESAAACGGINRLKEGANINKSLVALGNVISALAERGSTGSGPGRRFIPYRDSALTWLLKDALGGNATTVMLATISPASGSYNETSHTLRFAQRAQSVVNRPVINEDPVSRVIRELRAEVARLKALLVEQNINPDLDCKSICPCQRDKEEEVKTQGREEKKPEYEADYEVSIELRDLSIPERRHSTSESLSSCKSLLGPVRRFGSFEIVRESRTLSDSIEPDNYNCAKISELIIDDEVDEPVFVDIPTLVAVLIKPEDSNQVDSHQIEEIAIDGVSEDVTDSEFPGNVNNRVSSGNREYQNFQSNGTQVEHIASLEISKTLEHPPKISTPSGVTTFPPRGRGKLRKHDSIDGDLPSKVTSNLQSLKKYGSIESLPARKREIACSLQRSHTNLEKRNGSADKIKKLNNIKEVEDQRSIKLNNPWRNLGAWANRDFQRKGSNDSDKSLKDSPTLARAKNQARKQSIDGLKRKTSKDSSSSSSKDELLPSGGQVRDRSSRKGSLEHPEQVVARTHTPIQRARRAEIVAAVTERLYSSKKLSEDNNTTLPGTTATTPASEVRSPESTDVKLASGTRMRLQEISRKMLAKRRRICVDTQTENHQTIRVRDVASITEEPKIIHKDASILTDRHEDYETLPFVDSPVTRVKEMSTITDNDLQESVIRCKDAGNATDDYYEDYGVINSPRNDSGIMSDDTQNYAESNLSSTEISDMCPIGGRRSVELVENSTNTRMPAGLPNSGSQTKREDLIETRCSNCVARCCTATGHCHGSDVLDHPNNGQACHHPERNVISISLPDMVSITIETSNGLESKIKVFDGNEPVDERAVSLQDNVAQTDPKDALEIGTSTDDVFGQVCFHDFSTSVKPMITQTDGKTFRIENIFREPRGVTRATPRIEIVGNSSNDVPPTNSLIVTNSVGASIIPETRENATGMESDRCYSSRSLLGPRRSLVNDALMTWPSRWRSCGPNSTRKNPAYSMLLGNRQSLSDFSMETLKGRYDDTGYPKEKRLSPLVFDKKFLISDKLRSREDQMSRMKLNEGFSKKRSNEDVSMIGLKSPSIISMLNNKNDGELETNFSDDSLDPTEDDVRNDNGGCELVQKSPSESLKVVGKCRSEKACPPDLVAHTKNDKNDSSISIDDPAGFKDFDDDSHQIEIPKTKIDTALNLVTPISDFKTLILGDPCYTVNHTEDLDFAESSNQSSSSTLIDDEDYCYARIDVVEDMEQCLVNGGCSVAPKSIIKKTSNGATNSRDSSKCQTSCGSKNSENEYVSTKKVRFSIPEVIDPTSSDSEVCGNLTSDDEVVEQGPKSILEEYLGEAVVLIRNMNSMNEYMSAACASDKCRINGRNNRREKGKHVNYIEFEGRRISLDDETDKDAKSDDEDLDFNVESYDKCLKSMDRLEECLARVKRHDEILRDNYGIGQDGSTGAKLDLAKSSIDSNDTNKDLVDKEKSDESAIMKNWRAKSVIAKDETSKGENNNLRPREEDDKEAGSDGVEILENLKKLRTRRFSRFSDLRKSNPITYSQLRGRCSFRASDERTDKKEDVPAFTKTEISKVDGPEADANSLQTPDCYLMLPKMTRIENGNSSLGIKSCTSRPRFSLSKYDSSEESSSSNEALATFMESIDNVARSTDKFRYSGSPRAKFLQLLSERRRIVENTRSTGAS